MHKYRFLSCLKLNNYFYIISLFLISCTGGSNSQNQTQSPQKVEHVLFSKAYQLNKFKTSPNANTSYQAFTVNNSQQAFNSITWTYYGSASCLGTVLKTTIYESSTIFNLHTGTWSMNDSSNEGNCRVGYGSCTDEFNNTQSIQVTYRYGGGVYTGQCYSNAPSLTTDKLANWSAGSVACSNGSACSFAGSYAPDNLPSMTYYAYIVSANNDVFMTQINQTNGQLSFLSTESIPTGNTPGEIIVNPSNNNAYVANGLDSTMSMYSINQNTGILSNLTPSTIGSGAFPYGITITPTGKYVYVTNQADDDISMYSINQNTGELSALTPSIIAAGNTPYAITISPSGNYVYAANQNDNTISMFSINENTGLLTALSTPTINTGSTPDEITISPSGKYVYVVNMFDDTISMYNLIESTGQLLALVTPTISTGFDPVGIVISPSGKYAYVTNQSTNNISMYSINESTGQLSALTTPTIGTGVMPSAITVDPSGKYVYVTNQNDDTISIYSINESTGVLTFIGNFGGVDNPVSIVIASIPN